MSFTAVVSLSDTHTGAWREFLEFCVREIVLKDFLEIGAMVSHRASATLAETDAVSLSGSMKSDSSVFYFGGEVVAGHGIPAEATPDGEAASFAALK